MSERITIDVVCEEDQWSNEYGTYQAYMLDVKTEDGRVVGNVKSNRKLKDDGSHFEPKEGEEVWGTLESQKGGTYKLALDNQRMKNEPLKGGYEASTGTSGGSQNVSKGQSKETDWEVRNAEIRRQHSQEMALRFLSLDRPGWDYEHRDLPNDQFFRRVLVSLIDQFDQDAMEAGQNANQGAAPLPAGGSPRSGAAPDPPPAEQPVDFTGARTIDHADDSHQYLSKLIEDAGLQSTGAEAIAKWMLEEVAKHPEKAQPLKAIEARLQDLDTQAQQLQELKTRFEEMTGSLVPEPSDDSLPF